MKKNNTARKKSLQALKRHKIENKRKKKFKAQKYLWSRGIGLYEIYTEKERN